MTPTFKVHRECSKSMLLINQYMFLLLESMPVCVYHASIVHPQTYSRYHVSSSKSLANDREYTAFSPSTVFSALAPMLATFSRLLVPTAYQPADGRMRRK